jgi:signal transduction histidine kinase
MTQPVGDAHDRTVRWRQLVDLLSRRHEDIDPALLEAALTMVRTGMKSVARPIRAATARSISGRVSDPRLIAIFASDRLEVAAPLLASAPMDQDGWALVLAGASAEVAEFIRSLHGDLPAGQGDRQRPAGEPASEEPAPSIGEMVARIERLKSRREPAPESVLLLSDPFEGAPPPAEGEPMLFRWECDASGQIGWVEGAPRGALIGRSLPGDDYTDRTLIRAFTDRMPFDDAPLTFAAPALQGEWRLSGIPAFSPADGRFLGYRGIARKGFAEAARPAAAAAAPALTNDAETLRETIHEIKTPLNAIIGFAEIIDGQYLGPAHRNYRHRAAEIVTQARILLAAIEDLDFAARLQTRGGDGGSSEQLGAFLPQLFEELAAAASARDVRLGIAPLGPSSQCLIDRDLGERMIRRLVGAIVEEAEAGESIELSVRAAPGGCTIAVTRPGSTREVDEAQLLDPAFAGGEEGDQGRLGIGFALRLVRGLVRLAGGEMRVEASQIALSLPSAKS